MENNKQHKYLDYEGLSKYDEDLKAYIRKIFYGEESEKTDSSSDAKKEE